VETTNLLKKLEKVAIAKHCYLRPPDVVPVVLGFNYEADILHTIVPNVSKIGQSAVALYQSFRVPVLHFRHSSSIPL